MDAIDRILQKDIYISNGMQEKNQTWAEFEKETGEKDLILFGVSVGIRIFRKRYENRFKIVGIVDNDSRKQGFKLKDFIMMDGIEGNLTICGISSLDFCSREESVILVSSLNHDQEVAEQLSKLGFQHIYSLFMMESNERLNDGDVTRDEFGENERWVEECCKNPINPKKIVFEAYGTYTDHGKYITEQLLKCRQDLDILWVVNDLRTKVPKGVRMIHASNRMQYIFEMETAAIWVTNVTLPAYIIKREGQTYIETKHWASVTLKGFYLIESSTKEYKNIELVKYNGSIMDYIITGSDFDSESCRRGFDFHKEVVQIGSPRSDAMFRHEELREKVYEYYHFDMDKHMAVYAPTFRYQKGEEWHKLEIRNADLDYERVKRALERRFGGEWYIVLRLHPGMEKEAEKLMLPPYVIDASRYDDGQEIAAACDVMISDYSSIMFEPAFVYKPVFLLALDKEEYMEEERDLLIDYHSLPFPQASSNEELEQCIAEFEEQRYKNDVSSFLDKYGVHEDGHASERAACFISKLIDERGSDIAF